MFVDYVEITVKAGDGGHGCLSFRREKYVPKGGPDGGDGGRGGHVIARVDPHLATLLDLRYQRLYRAAKGGDGQGKDLFGREGEDRVIPVPPGTTIKDLNTGKVIADLTLPDQEVLLARGGRGGHGNAFFKSSTNRAPRRFEAGKKGEEKRLTFELKLIADVGLVGFPNVGKSTLLAKVSRARPKIAPYPFTTLTPHLGIVRVGDWRSFVLADIPGIIAGAHQGKGLGLEFLRHIQRTRVLVYLLDATSSTLRRDYQILKAEVKAYDPEITRKPSLVVLNKIDLLNGQPKKTLRVSMPVFYISALTGQGIKELLFGLEEVLGSVSRAA